MTQNLELINFPSITGQGFTITAYGESVASAGDVNNDGFDDIIIGAPSERSNAGTSYVIYGNSSNLGSIDLTNLGPRGFAIYGVAANDRSGDSVSSAGDINNDGYDDIIIGAYQADPSSRIDAGTSYVIYGNNTSSNTNIDLANLGVRGFSIYGAGMNDRTGFSVASAGDVNSDGYDDIIIGAPAADPHSRPSAGTSYVIYGNVTSSNTNIDLINDLGTRGFTIYGAAANDQRGYSVSSAGDVNNDGFDDIIIGAVHDWFRSLNVSAYVIFGNITSSNTNIDLANLGAKGFAIYGAAAGDYSGFSVSAAGDVNNDGFDDIIIGAPSIYWYNILSAIYVIYGNITSSNTNIDLGNLGAKGFAIYGAAYGDKSGWSVASAGDVNNDGFDDIIIGAPYAAPNSRGLAGTSYVIYGNITNSNSNINLDNLSSRGVAIYGAAAHAQSGVSVSSAGDINHDGFDDLIIGGGLSYVIYGAVSGFITPNPTIIPTMIPTIVPTVTPTTFLPSFSPTLAPTFQDPLTIKLATLTFAQGFSIKGTYTETDFYYYDDLANDDESKYSVSKAGDINGDGLDDVIIGMSTASPNSRHNAGESYIIYGIPSNPGTIDLLSYNFNGFSIYGENPGDKSGFSVNGVGDINKDGLDDIIIGAPGANFGAGICYVIFGTTSIITDIDLTNLTPSQGFRVYGASPGDKSGWSVSGADDINNDGYDDIVIGAPGVNSGDGRTYIIFGKSGLNGVELATDLTTAGLGFFISGNGGFGWSVSGAGDINNDGYDDIVIGSPFVRDAYIGKSYVSLEKESTFTNINLASSAAYSHQGFYITGANNSYHSGYSVSGAGDINGDGYDDIIIGAPAYIGTSHVIYGKANSFTDINLNLLTPAQGFSINAHGGQSSWSVSGAGDINNDGYDDIIIGTAGNSTVGISYVVFGKMSPPANISLANLNYTQGFSIIGAPRYYSGHSVSSAGDINGDGYDDIIIGAYAASNYASISFIIFGKSSQTPTNLPVSIPTHVQTLYPTQASMGYPTLLPTHISTLVPTHNQSSLSPTVEQAVKPTVAPSIIPTFMPTSAPTVKPTVVPSIVPTFMPTQAVYITDGGIYNGSTASENFIIDSSSDITISGGGGNDMYSLKPHGNVAVTIADFNKDSDIINLQSFNIHHFNELNITAGSIIITLEDNQKMRLLNLNPGDIDENNFIFNIIPTTIPTTEPSLAPSIDAHDDNQQEQSSNDIMVGVAAAAAAIGGVLLGFVGCWQYSKHFDHTNNKVYVSNIEGDVEMPI